MQKAKQILVTEEGLRKIESELEYLKNEKRKEIIETIKTARSFGDLSENSEYDEAKNEQAKVEAQILELEEILKNVKVIEEHEIDIHSINIGSVVTVLNENLGKEFTYNIVGSTEADPFKNKISDESPMGKCLIGKTKGESAQFESAAGTVTLKILDITK